MRSYIIRLVATGNDPTADDYQAYYMAYHDETNAWLGGVSADKNEDYVSREFPPRLKIIVQQELVLSEDGTIIHAIKKFQRWLKRGFDKSYLLEPQGV